MEKAKKLIMNSFNVSEKTAADLIEIAFKHGEV